MTTSTDALDLGLDANGDLDLANGDATLVSGPSGVLQIARLTVGLVRGEWFQDLDQGIPYFARDGVPENVALMGQRFSKLKVLRAFYTELNKVPFSSNPRVTVDFTVATRQADINFTLDTDFGETITDSLELQS